MNKKGQIELFTNPKTISFTLGGALIGYFIFQNIESTILGGILGFILSFIR
jgi:hypothetical protein